MLKGYIGTQVQQCLAQTVWSGADGLEVVLYFQPLPERIAALGVLFEGRLFYIYFSAGRGWQHRLC
ncbi:hypothetical protein A8C56_11335 [Niabella ginsenosidivorans]|uniref:Uncharacterized protein n=1 Tax=Niabella ginsenosidivorans TaxID=1176587 RepID=A0A1A9I491_9BACT|nr:hypothetical protein A8C56_11335 [Niabella ginsenosidivorans]